MDNTSKIYNLNNINTIAFYIPNNEDSSEYINVKNIFITNNKLSNIDYKNNYFAYLERKKANITTSQIFSFSDTSVDTNYYMLSILRIPIIEYKTKSDIINAYNKSYCESIFNLLQQQYITTENNSVYYYTQPNDTELKENYFTTYNSITSSDLFDASNKYSITPNENSTYNMVNSTLLYRTPTYDLNIERNNYNIYFAESGDSNKSFDLVINNKETNEVLFNFHYSGTQDNKDNIYNIYSEHEQYSEIIDSLLKTTTDEIGNKVINKITDIVMDYDDTKNIYKITLFTQTSPNNEMKIYKRDNDGNYVFQKDSGNYVYKKDDNNNYYYLIDVYGYPRPYIDDGRYDFISDESGNCKYITDNDNNYITLKEKYLTYSDINLYNNCYIYDVDNSDESCYVYDIDEYGYQIYEKKDNIEDYEFELSTDINNQLIYRINSDRINNKISSDKNYVYYSDTWRKYVGKYDNGTLVYKKQYDDTEGKTIINIKDTEGNDIAVNDNTTYIKNNDNKIIETYKTIPNDEKGDILIYETKNTASSIEIPQKEYVYAKIKNEKIKMGTDFNNCITHAQYNDSDKNNYFVENNTDMHLVYVDENNKYNIINYDDKNKLTKYITNTLNVNKDIVSSYKITTPTTGQFDENNNFIVYERNVPRFGYKDIENDCSEELIFNQKNITIKKNDDGIITDYKFVSDKVVLGNISCVLTIENGTQTFEVKDIYRHEFNFTIIMTKTYFTFKNDISELIFPIDPKVGLNGDTNYKQTNENLTYGLGFTYKYNNPFVGNYFNIMIDKYINKTPTVDEHYAYVYMFPLVPSYNNITKKNYNNVGYYNYILDNNNNKIPIKEIKNIALKDENGKEVYVAKNNGNIQYRTTDDEDIIYEYDKDDSGNIQYNIYEYGSESYVDEVYIEDYKQVKVNDDGSVYYIYGDEKNYIEVNEQGEPINTKIIQDNYIYINDTPTKKTMLIKEPYYRITSDVTHSTPKYENNKYVYSVVNTSGTHYDLILDKDKKTTAQIDGTTVTFYAYYNDKDKSKPIIVYCGEYNEKFYFIDPRDTTTIIYKASYDGNYTIAKKDSSSTKENVVEMTNDGPDFGYSGTEYLYNEKITNGYKLKGEYRTLSTIKTNYTQVYLSDDNINNKYYINEKTGYNNGYDIMDDEYDSSKNYTEKDGIVEKKDKSINIISKDDYKDMKDINENILYKSDNDLTINDYVPNISDVNTATGIYKIPNDTLLSKKIQYNNGEFTQLNTTRRKYFRYTKETTKKIETGNNYSSYEIVSDRILTNDDLNKSVEYHEYKTAKYHQIDTSFISLITINGTFTTLKPYLTCYIDRKFSLDYDLMTTYYDTYELANIESSDVYITETNQDIKPTNPISYSLITDKTQEPIINTIDYIYGDMCHPKLKPIIKQRESVKLNCLQLEKEIDKQKIIEEEDMNVNKYLTIYADFNATKPIIYTSSAPHEYIGYIRYNNTYLGISGFRFKNNNNTVFNTIRTKSFVDNTINTQLKLINKYDETNNTITFDKDLIPVNINYTTLVDLNNKNNNYDIVNTTNQTFIDLNNIYSLNSTLLKVSNNDDLIYYNKFNYSEKSAFNYIYKNKYLIESLFDNIKLINNEPIKIINGNMLVSYIYTGKQIFDYENNKNTNVNSLLFNNTYDIDYINNFPEHENIIVKYTYNSKIDDIINNTLLNEKDVFNIVSKVKFNKDDSTIDINKIIRLSDNGVYLYITGEHVLQWPYLANNAILSYSYIS